MLQTQYAGASHAEAATVMSPGKYLGPFPYEDGTLPEEGEGIKVMSSDGQVMVLPPGRYLGPYPVSERSGSLMTISEALPESPTGAVFPEVFGPVETNVPLSRSQSPLRQSPPRDMSNLTAALNTPQLAPYKAFLKRIAHPSSPPQQPIDFATLLHACRKPARPSSNIMFKGGGKYPASTLTFPDGTKLSPHDKGVIEQVLPARGNDPVTLRCKFHGRVVLLEADDVVVL